MSSNQLSFLADTEIHIVAPTVAGSGTELPSVEGAREKNAVPAERRPEAVARPAVLGGRVENPPSAIPSDNERYLSVKEVGARYSVSVQTVWRHTKHNPSFPQPIKILNGSTRWRMSDILAFEISRQEASR